MANMPDSESVDCRFDSYCGNQKLSSGRTAIASVFEADTLTGLQVRVLWGDQNNMGIKRPCIKNVGKKIPFDIS